MAISFDNVYNLFWKLFNIAGGGTEPDVTKVLDSIVKSDRAKLDQYFSNSVDQIAFDTADWERLRAFFIDLFVSHRSLITNSSIISDPYNLPNDDLDELFRSFGYPESPRLKNFDNNPLENKVRLFLDLVNLYKIKGTPRSILEVLQYYGIPELDIFEFWLQKEDPDNLIFRGNVIAGTSVNPSPVSLPFDLLTFGDPHWMMSHAKVLELDQLNKINLPSKSPYFAVQPVVEIGVENAMLVRIIQDQYASWESTGDLPPQNAEITILGVTTSLLELYLLTLYSFQKDYDVGTAVDDFACYDGTATSAADILAEYDALIAEPIVRDRYIHELSPNNRTAYSSSEIIPAISKWERYLDLFTRKREEHFLYNKGDNAATTVLNTINPALIPELEALTANNTVVLQDLLKDLAVWVRNNIGFGFVNLGYVFFGLNQLFKDLAPVINFFKPYRARLIVLELLQFKNLLTESIPLNDDIAYDTDTEIIDFMTANSTPCCDSDLIPLDNLQPIPSGFSFVNVTFTEPLPSASYNLNVNLIGPNTTESFETSIYSVTVVYKDQYGFKALLSSPVEVDGYNLSWRVDPASTKSGINYLNDGTDVYRIDFASPMASADYSIGTTISNEVDVFPYQYGYMVTEKDVNGFTLRFSDIIDTPNFKVDWNVYNATTVPNETINLIPGTNYVDVSLGMTMQNNEYALSLSLMNTDETAASIYSIVTADKTVTGFRVYFSGTLESDKYYLSWAVTYETPPGHTSDVTIDCLDTTTASYYSRETYDCGSYHDIGAVSDFQVPIEMMIEQNLCDSMRCPTGCLSDTTATTVATYEGICDRLSPVPSYFDGTHALRIAPDSTDCTELIPMTCENVPIVFSEVIQNTFENVEDLRIGSTRAVVYFNEPQSTSNYVLNVNLINEIDGAGNISMYGIIVSEKAEGHFVVEFSSPLDSANYKIVWSVNPLATLSGFEPFNNGSDILRVNFGYSLTSSDYSIGTSIVNQADPEPSKYNFTVVEKDVDGFKLQLSSPIDSPNYVLDWNIYDSTAFVEYPSGSTSIPNGQDWVDVDIIPDEANEEFMLSASIVNTVDGTDTSIYSYMITKKSNEGFQVAFSSPMDSPNYELSWAVTYRNPEIYEFRQDSGFRMFDTMGKFDCTHGFDSVEVTMDIISQVGVIITEDGNAESNVWLLQEDAIDTSVDDYGILWD